MGLDSLIKKLSGGKLSERQRVPLTMTEKEEEVLKELASLEPSDYIPHGNEGFGELGMGIYGMHITKLPQFKGWPLFPESRKDYFKFKERGFLKKYPWGHHLPWECNYGPKRKFKNLLEVPFEKFSLGNKYLQLLYEKVGKIDLGKIKAIWVEPGGIIYNREEEKKRVILQPAKGISIILGEASLKFLTKKGEKLEAALSRQGEGYILDIRYKNIEKEIPLASAVF